MPVRGLVEASGSVTVCMGAGVASTFMPCANPASPGWQLEERVTTTVLSSTVGPLLMGTQGLAQCDPGSCFARPTGNRWSLVAVTMPSASWSAATTSAVP